MSGLHGLRPNKQMNSMEYGDDMEERLLANDQ